MKAFFHEIPMDRETASFFAAGLRMLAEVDGFHDAELALIGSFEGGLEVEATAFDLSGDHPLDTAEKAELFMRSAILLALADGGISEMEGELIGRWAHALSIPVERLADLFKDVKVYLLSTFEDSTLFREQAEKIGEELGLDKEDITTTLQ
jgi:hypothetical protein